MTSSLIPNAKMFAKFHERKLCLKEKRKNISKSLFLKCTDLDKYY